jgi:hypothetical protein
MAFCEAQHVEDETGHNESQNETTKRNANRQIRHFIGSDKYIVTTKTEQRMPVVSKIPVIVGENKVAHRLCRRRFRVRRRRRS